MINLSILSVKADNTEIQGYTILPEIDASEASQLTEVVSWVWAEWWKVMEIYTKQADARSWDIEKQLATWIMTRDTLINYLVYVVKFLSQLWLAVWAWFIIYAWYTYMLSVFNWWKAKPEVIKNAIIWVIIVIFSYAIMKTLTAIFLWS